MMSYPETPPSVTEAIKQAQQHVAVAVQVLVPALFEAPAHVREVLDGFITDAPWWLDQAMKEAGKS